MCENCKELRYQNIKLRDENLTLNRRIQVLQIQNDALRAKQQELTFFTVEQVADYLQMSRPTISRFIASGKLKAISSGKGGTYRIAYKDLMAFIAQSTAEQLEVCEC